MTARTATKAAAFGMLVTFGSAAAFAQGTGNNQPLNPVPTHKPTPARYMQHPRAVPESTTTDSLNAMSLQAAQKGTNFAPPPPPNEHQKAGMTQ